MLDKITTLYRKVEMGIMHEILRGSMNVRGIYAKKGDDLIKNIYKYILSYEKVNVNHAF